VNAVGSVRPDADRFLAVGEHVVDTDTLRLLSRPDGIRLTPKAAAVLLQLVRAAGRTLSRDELIGEVWKGTCPTDDVLTQAIRDLRRAFGDDPHAPSYVETLPRLGYRLVAPARFLDAQELISPQPTTAHADFSPEPSLVEPPAGSPRGWRWLVLAVGAVFALSAWLAFALLSRTNGTTSTPARWHATTRRSVTSDPGAEREPRISPDGTRVAYTVENTGTGSSRIMQRSLDASRALGLTSAARGEELHPVWSPDGSTIAYMLLSGDDCELVIEPSLGGAERRIGPCPGSPLDHFSWASDARNLVMAQLLEPRGTAKVIALVPIDGSRARTVNYERAPSDTDLDARYSPDGRSIAFCRSANPFSDLYVMDAQDRSVRRLTRLVSTIRGFDWTRDGTALVFSSGHAGQQALYTVSLDDSHLDALGVQPAEFPSAARASDAVVYEIPRRRTQLVMVALDGATEPPRALAPSTGSDGAPALSPTDDRLAFVSDRGGAQQLWLHDPVTDETFALTDTDEPTLRYPVWRQDGARVLITARGEGWGHLVEIDVATRARTVLTSPDDDIRYGTYGFSPGRFIAIVNDARQGRELVEFESRDGRVASKRLLARDVGRFEPDRAGTALYFTRVDQAGLFRIDPRTGAESLVTRDIDPRQLDGWLVSAGQFFYVEPHAIGRSDLHVLDLASGSERMLATMPAPLADLNFSISRDRTHVAAVQVAALDTDIGAITLQRGPGGKSAQAATAE
jgi:Tol biopolymer transport system component/DNA-binding winged helix-turn-helix (wHTH) protein